MSNPLDSHLQTLREATPRPEAINLAVAALRRPHTSRLIPLTATVAALSALALWPRGTAGLAWSQIADQDLALRYHETRVVVAGGKSRIVDERWLDRLHDSTRDHLHIFRDFPSEGHSVTTNPFGRDFEFIDSPLGFYGKQDLFATYTRKIQPKSKYDPRLAKNVGGRTGLEKLLGDKRIRQLNVERDVATRVGKADRYVLERTRDARSSDAIVSFVVYVRPGTKRILGTDEREASGDVWQCTFDYPVSFPADTFTFPPKGVKAYDLDALNAKVEARLRSPLATLRAGGQTSVLRLVAQDDMKNLWVLWSGAPPNGDLKQKVEVLGMTNGAASSGLPFVSKGFNGAHARFGGHAVRLNRQVDRVDLQVPVFAPGKGHSTFVGDATVLNVTVLHLPFVDNLDSVSRVQRNPKGTATPRKP